MSLIAKAIEHDNDPPSNILWASEYTADSYRELTLVTTWSRWGIGFDIEVDEYRDYPRSVIKRRWWGSLQFGPWHLFWSSERTRP